VFLQTADTRASNVSLESRITPRMVNLFVVGKTEDAIDMVPTTVQKSISLTFP